MPGAGSTIRLRMESFMTSLEPELRARILAKSDRAGWLAVARSIGLAMAALTLAALWPHPLTILVSVVDQAVSFWSGDVSRALTR